LHKWQVTHQTLPSYVREFFMLFLVLLLYELSFNNWGRLNSNAWGKKSSVVGSTQFAGKRVVQPVRNVSQIYTLDLLELSCKYAHNFLPATLLRYRDWHTGVLQTVPSWWHVLHMWVTSPCARPGCTAHVYWILTRTLISAGLLTWV